MYDSSVNMSVSKTKSQTMVFGTSKRDLGIVGKATIDLPGPGNYDTSAKKSGPAYRFGGKMQQKHTEGPGPGAYE
jgi:hypothetical protein